MKLMNFIKTQIGIIILILTISSCNRKDKSPIITQEFELTTLTDIDLAIAGNVTIIEGEEQKIVVTGPEKTLSKLSKKVSNNKWTISLPNSYKKSYDKMEITITSNQIKDITISGSGGVSASHSLPISYLKIDGSGDIDVKASSSTIYSSIDGSGNIYLSGTTNTINHDIDGSGNLKAFELQAQNGNCTINGSGNIEVNVIQSLKATIDGSGDIYYKGNPNLNSNINGSGNIIRR